MTITPNNTSQPLDASDFTDIWAAIQNGASAADGEQLAAAMNTIVLRDAILSETARQRAWGKLEHAAVIAARTANTQHTPVAGPMTLHALACTVTGDTGSAVVLLDIVLTTDPDYTLAQLAARALCAGLPGHHIADLFASIPLADCLRL